MSSWSGLLMKREIEIGEAGEVSEMTIVDTFTKLIFGQESEYSDSDLQIIQTLRHVDDHVLVDSHRDMGIYLRALGVREMIALVSQVRQALSSSAPHPQYLDDVTSPRLRTTP
jgi:hypothetical protein